MNSALSTINPVFAEFVFAELIVADPISANPIFENYDSQWPSLVLRGITLFCITKQKPSAVMDFHPREESIVALEHFRSKSAKSMREVFLVD
jgi:hypothetical protein